MTLDGELVDLNNLEVRKELEERHASLLLKHGMDHLDLHEWGLSLAAA